MTGRGRTLAPEGMSVISSGNRIYRHVQNGGKLQDFIDSRLNIRVPKGTGNGPSTETSPIFYRFYMHFGYKPFLPGLPIDKSP